ncbi:uncharacterized protein LOC135308337 [Passer domesticus]|uniref:uncharacterized protein LOC135308337 n=1 Tax=Passer domesticus TaxID=48849 RepID=UPI0030FE7B3C
MAGRKFQDPLEIMWQMLKERLQRRQEMKGEPAEKEAFPGGSSGCMPASAPGREAMPGTGTGDEGAGKASPSAWMNKVLKPLEPPADVSTGKTSPASPAATLDAALKPSSHLRGTPTGKIQDTTDKISLEATKQMRQELKDPLQTREEMDIVLQWKVVFLEGSTPSSVPAPAAGRKAKPDTGTGTADWDAGKDSPLAWRSEVVKPSEHSAGVSAGTTSPTPTLDAAQKASSHGRGPLTGKTKDMAGRKFQDPLEIMWQMLKERLQRRQEMKGEPAEKEAFPGGSSGCMPASAPGREAMPGTGTGDEGAGKASPSAWMNKVLKPLEPPADVSTGKTSPASPAATLDAALKPSSHLRGTPTGKIQDTTDKISLEATKQMRQELKDPLQTREEMDIVLQWKVVFLEGSTPSSVPAPAAGRKAKPDTGTGTADWDAGKDSPLAWRSEVVKPSEHSAGVSAGTTSPTPTLDAAQKASSHGRGPLTGETKDMAGRKFQDPLEIMWQMLKERLQRRQEMKGEPAEKEAFPGGSSGCMPASAPGREAMPGTGTGDEGAGKASPSAWMNKVLKPLEPPADVSTGKTSPASPAATLDAALKPSSHLRGTPTGKIQDTTDKISLEATKQMRQELKDPLQTREEMDIVLQWKVVFLEGSTPSSVPAPAAGRKAKPDTGTGTADWDAGKDSPLAWRSEVVKHSEHSAGVSAGTTSPTPTLDAAQKASSHGRGPLTGETKDMAGRKFQDPLEIMWQMLKERLQRRQEMKGEPAEKEAFPGGSSGCMPASAPGREAMPGTGTGDEGAGKASPSAWMNKVLKPLEPPADVSTGKTSPASPAATLDAALKPSSHLRGTPTGKIQDTTDKISLEATKQMRQELKEPLQTREEMDIVLQWKVVFLEGSTPSSVPAPAAGRKAKPDTGTGTTGLTIALAFLLPESQNNTAVIAWTRHISRGRPQLTCVLKHLGQAITLTGLIDTGADVTLISRSKWPQDWTVVPTLDQLAAMPDMDKVLASTHKDTVPK